VILCECGEFIKGDIFKDYIKTSINPSTATIGHTKCGCIFDFLDGRRPKKYSSRKELKILAMRFAKKHDLDNKSIEIFLIEVDRLKSSGQFTDHEIIIKALSNL